jgi:hypothetical protein
MTALLCVISRRLKRILKNQEILMANYDKLNADLAALSAKVDGLIAKVNAPAHDPVVDEQPAVDAADAAVADIIAKIP